MVKVSIEATRPMVFALLVMSCVSVAMAAVATLEIVEGPLEVTAATTFDNKTYRYEGHGHAIRDDLTLDNTTYLRLKGGTKTSPDTLSFGPVDRDAANQHPVVTIRNKSGFYATYRNPSSAFLDDPTDKAGVQSYLTFNVGENGGSGKFVVKCRGQDFANGNISGDGLWLWQLTVSANADTNETGYIDILQLDSGGYADIDKIVNDNVHPARIIYNGGTLRDNLQTRSGDASPFMMPAGRVIVNEGVNGNHIKIEKSYYSETINNGMGTVRFQGNCNVILTESGNVLKSNRLAWGINASKGPIEWNQTGSLNLGSHVYLFFVGDNGYTPYGPSSCEVRMLSDSIIDLDGTTQRFRSLVAESPNAWVTNVAHSATLTSKLVFGTGDADGVFAANCAPNVSVEKIGAGRLVVSNATVFGSFVVKEGVVEFHGNNHIPNLVIEDGARVVAGVVTSSDAIKTLDFSPAPNGEPVVTYLKDDADDIDLHAGESLSGKKLDIRSGKVRFTGSCADKFWRWTIKAGMAATDGTLGGINLELGELWLWPSNYTRVSSASADYQRTPTYGIVTNSAAEQALITSPAQLAQGRCMAEPQGLTWEHDRDGSGRDYDGPDVLFNNSFTLLWHVQKNPNGTTSRPGLDDTNSWFSVAFRLKDTAPPVSGYAVCRTHWSNGAGAWILSSSATGADGTWTVRDEHTAQWANTVGMTSAAADLVSEYPHCDDNNPETGKSQKASDKWYANKGIYRFTSGGSAFELLTNVAVSVAEGATLDTSYVNDEALSISRLEVNGTGGTITKFAPAPNGRLYLTNVTMSATMKKILTVSQVVHPENFASWKVYADGVEVTDARIRFVDGELQVGVKPGTILGIECVKLFTPETSQHFRRYEDPYSGVVSYILDTRLGYNQQSFYFTHNSMTDDGRFLLFSVSAGHEPCTRYLGMVDFRYDTCEFINATGWMPYIAMESDTLYYVNSGGFFKRNLRRAPTNEVFVCAIPEALKAEGNRIYRYCTHLTLTQDRKGAFLDLRIDDRFVQGLVHLDTCTWEKWGETDFHINHGQLNPHCDQLALCAYETVAWTDTKGVVHQGLELVDGIYPRLQLIAKNFRQMVPAKVFNVASHEKWDGDGRGFYWCGNGVWHHDLSTENQICLMPLDASHATCSADLGLVTYDARVKESFRGQPWQVGFYNRTTGRGTYIFSRREAYCTRDNESEMHPDAHPQIVCRDRYIVCTVNHGDGRMDLAVTPVAPLVAKTTPKKGDPFGELVGFDAPYTFAMRFAERISGSTRVTDAALYDKIVEIGERYGNLSFVTNMIAKGGRPSGVGVISGTVETPQEIMASQRDDALWGEGTDPDLEKSATFVRRLVIAYRDANGKGEEATACAAAAVRAWRAFAARMGNGGTYPSIPQSAIAAIIDCALLMDY